MINNNKTFIQVCKFLNGTITRWYYKEGQLVEVTIEHPEGHLSAAEEQNKLNKKLPKTKQRFINPKTGKEISYQRAKELGIIK